MKGINDSEINSLVEYAVGEDVALRFIELMPMGEAARMAEDPAPLEDVRREVEREWGLEEGFRPKRKRSGGVLPSKTGKRVRQNWFHLPDQS